MPTEIPTVVTYHPWNGSQSYRINCNNSKSKSVTLRKLISQLWLSSYNTALKFVDLISNNTDRLTVNWNWKWNRKYSEN